MPVDLPNVYSRTGGVLLGQRSQDRQNYRVTELQGWCRKLGMYVNPRPKFMCPNAEVTIPRQSRGHSGCEPLKAAVRGR